MWENAPSFHTFFTTCPLRNGPSKFPVSVVYNADSFSKTRNASLSWQNNEVWISQSPRRDFQTCILAKFKMLIFSSSDYYIAIFYRPTCATLDSFRCDRGTGNSQSFWRDLIIVGNLILHVVGVIVWKLHFRYISLVSRLICICDLFQLVWR